MRGEQEISFAGRWIAINGYIEDLCHFRAWLNAGSVKDSRCMHRRFATYDDDTSRRPLYFPPFYVLHQSSSPSAFWPVVSRRVPHHNSTWCFSSLETRPRPSPCLRLNIIRNIIRPISNIRFLHPFFERLSHCRFTTQALKHYLAIRCKRVHDGQFRCREHHWHDIYPERDKQGDEDREANRGNSL